MSAFLSKIWKKIRGPWQWYILWLFHHKFIIGVSGIVFNQHGQILLLRHRYWKTNSWGLPSGYANRTEKLEDAICREIKEETGYDVEITSLLKIVSGYKLRIETVWTGRLVGGDLRLDYDEVLEARFFSIDGLPAGILDSHRETISQFISQNKND